MWHPIGLGNPAREPSAQPLSKSAFDFEKRKLNTDEVRELIYNEILEYHPTAKLHHYNAGVTNRPQQLQGFPLDQFRRFSTMEGGGGAPLSQRRMSNSASMPKERGATEVRADAAPKYGQYTGANQALPMHSAVSAQSTTLGASGFAEGPPPANGQTAQHYLPNLTR